MPELPSEQFVIKFNAKVGEFRADELLRRLEQKACGLDLILTFLELYCRAQIVSPIQKSISALRLRKKALADQLDKFAGSLTEVAAQVERINREPDVAQHLAWYGRQLFALPGEIRAYVSLLPAISKELRDVSLRTAPMDALNLLADFMKESSGELNYDDLALLLGIGYAACGVKEELTSDDVRRRLRRARGRK
jgi:hypothetical protein